MEKQTEEGDMFFRPEEELKTIASLEYKKKLGDLWYERSGYPFHIDFAGRWRKDPLGKQWHPICLNAPEWILSEFTYCFYEDDVGKDAIEILKDFAYFLYRNELTCYVRMAEHDEPGRPTTPCFVGTGKTDYAGRSVTCLSFF